MTFLGKYSRQAGISVHLYQKGVQNFIGTASMCLMASHRVYVTIDSFTSNTIKGIAPLTRGVKKMTPGENITRNL